ncbi:MAG: DUF362 domain-containing protein, partial [Deltaproteobacteria bacterium]|nr:DUF362 domain-containing protein [Deltaproteobacteria bacterium]
TFLKTAACLGVGALVSQSPLSSLAQSSPQGSPAPGIKPDLVAVKGKDPYVNTLRAIQEFGGIETFVRRGDRVGILVNSPFKNLGASVNPDVVLAVLEKCLDGGAKEIRYLKDPHRGYWDRSARSGQFASVLKGLKYETGDDVKVEIPGGLSLKDAKVTKDLWACDVFINISISKHHEGVHYSGALKNMMGLCPFSTNSYFHYGTLKLGWYADVEHLSQCIADLNLVRKPDLCISDATTFIKENGPWGPGKLGSAETVVASTNGVSLDAFCCRFQGVQPEEVLMIPKASKHGLGEMNLDRLRIKSLSV